MTDILSARLREYAQSKPSGKTHLTWKAADEIDRLTATVKEYHREKQLVLDAAKGMDDFRAKADALAEAATKLTIELAALVLSSDEDLDIELGDIAAALTAFQNKETSE